MQRVLKSRHILALIAVCLCAAELCKLTYVKFQAQSSEKQPLQPHLEKRLTETSKWSQQHRKTDSAIPKILHFVFKSQMVFEAYKPLIRSCLDQNPEWQVFLWRDSDSERLVKDHYEFFASKFRGYRDRLEKSDSVRYMILHKFGGIYLDMDVQCLRPFSQLLQSAPSAFLGEERREQTRILYGYSFCTMNSLMGSEPGHPFFLSTIHRMQQMPDLNHARLSTGPHFLTNCYRSWLNCSDCQQAAHPVTVFPAQLVSPLMDTSLVNWEQKCSPFFRAGTNGGQPHRSRLSGEAAWNALGCGELVSKGWQYDDTDDSTVAVHKFTHMGYGNQRGRGTFDLLKEFPRVKTHYPV